MDCKTLTVAQIEEKLAKLAALEAREAGTAERAVVVCTDKRGVFFGYLRGPNKTKRLVLHRARMCVYWAPGTKGVVGLASHGPKSPSKITAAAPSVELVGITAILDCSPEAVAAWELAPWG